MIEGVSAWSSTAVEEDADIGLQDGTEGLEEPTVGIDFLLILFLKTKEHLARDNPFFGTTGFALDNAKEMPYRNWSCGSILICVVYSKT